jgi:hypothetical protein
MPSAILIGIGGSVVYRWVFENPGLSRSWNALLAWLGTVTLIGGAIISIVWYSQIVNEHTDDAHAIDWLESKQSDLILADDYIATILYTKAPSIYERIHQLGWGIEVSRKDIVPVELADVLISDRPSQPVDTILVVLYPNELGRNDRSTDFVQRFPNLSKLVEANFDLAASIRSSHVQGLLYRRKSIEHTPDN